MKTCFRAYREEEECQGHHPFLMNRIQRRDEKGKGISFGMMDDGRHKVASKTMGGKKNRMKLNLNSMCPW